MDIPAFTKKGNLQIKKRFKYFAEYYMETQLIALWVLKDKSLIYR